MRYKIEEMENQIIEALQAESALSGVTIATHAGEISGAYFEDPTLFEGLTQQLPFIFVQYQGKTKMQSDSVKRLDIHAVKFRFFVAAESLRATRESQISAYELLRGLYDTIHGTFFNYTGAAFTPVLAGTQITTAMRQIEPLTEQGGSNEALRVNLPRIVVYSTDYVCQVLA